MFLCLYLKRRRRRMTKTNLIGPVVLCASAHGYWRGYDDFGCKISKKLKEPMLGN